MPQATTSGTETEKHDLKTLIGGYVVIRRMTYGEYLKRQQMTSNMKISSSQQDDYAGVMELINKQAIQYEFANCITDHNLEDESGNKLDFRKEGDVDRLASKIGNEVNSLINKINAFEETEQGNSESASDSES